MSLSKKRLINGETTIKVSKETLHQLKIIKAQEDLKTISDTIDFVFDKLKEKELGTLG